MPLSRAGQPQGLLPWMLPSLCAALSAVMLLILSGLFFAFPCRWLVQNGEWVYPVILGPLFVLTFCCLIALNGSDPGTLHQGSNELDPMMMPVVWVNHRAFHLQWCPKCRFHRPPRTHHCPRCNICVEDFDHHSRWVNNCVGHRNYRLYLLLVLSLCLYTLAVLVACVTVLVRTTHLPYGLDKIITIGVAVPAAGFLVPLFVLLLIKAWSVSKAERSHEGKYQYLYVKNPFDLGCARNWCFTIFAPRGPKYMAEAVGLQRAVGPDWVPMQTLHCSTGPSGPVFQPSPGQGLAPTPKLRVSTHRDGLPQGVEILQISRRQL
uniref:Palmitoyltransferase n=1 Tax=Equus caballus TaxID=9796 RepID=A0A9L0SMT8_HORSE|nr:probable palmitoyltransferase ZDHHC19 isoform X2 [Equus caballus]